MSEPTIGTKQEISFIDRMLAATLLKIIPETVRPNQVTGFRFAIIPLVLLLIFIGENGWALGTFLIAAFSDAIDGAMARTRNMITDWGKLYDPLADKLLVGSVVVVMLTRFINLYLASGIILIELLLIANAFYQKEIKKRVIQAVLAGKLKMVLQTVGVGLIFLYATFHYEPLLFWANIVLYAALILGAISLFVYKSI